jgi:hypothetical protein
MATRELWQDGQLVGTEEVPDEPVDNSAQVLAVLGQLTADQLQRVVTLGVAITEPAAVDALVAAVADNDAVSGVAVVAEAAATAHDAAEG